MALTVGTDTFIAKDDANDYCANHPFGAAWAGIAEDQREKLLRLAARLLNDGIAWAGLPTATNQPLAWPRTGLKTRNGAALPNTTIPTEIANAQVEFARRLIGTDLSDDNVIANLRIVKAGDTSFADGVQRKVIPDAVRDLIPRGWIVSVTTEESSARRMRSIPLARG